MFALVAMLLNCDKNTFHPIFYFDSPMPGPIDEGFNATSIRYKSKGHHTSGFANREDAVKSANDLKSQLEGQGHFVTIELENDLPWDGKEIPTDHQIRPMPKKES